MRFIEDDKLPLGVVRKEITESEHALCCTECGFELPFNPNDPHSIGRPLYVLAMHNCAEREG